MGKRRTKLEIEQLDNSPTIKGLRAAAYVDGLGYHRVWFRGKQRRLSHAIWNLLHPDDPILVDEVVHHIDGNRLNDDPLNHKKMTKLEHQEAHREERERGLFIARSKANVEIVKRRSYEN